jgi:hypothetical protein
MALDSKNNIKSVFIVPDQSYTAETKMFPGQDTGAVAICDLNNTVLASATWTASDHPVIKIIKDRGANLPLQQVRLNLADLSAYTGAEYDPATEQFSYIGFNGTSGSINGYLGTLDGTFYIVKLEHVPNAFAYGKRPANYKYGTFQSPVSGTTQKDVSQGLVRSLVQNFKPNRTIDWRVKSEMTCFAAFADATPTTVILTRYSRQATVTGTVPSVGDAIRIGELGSGTVGAGDGIYIVESVNGLVITFNYAYQGPSGTAVAAEIELEQAGPALSTADYGIKITGIKQKYDVNRWRQYDKVRFNALLENFSSDTPVTNTAAFDGLGVYEQVANDEYISWGDEGQVFVDQVPPQFREQDAQIGGEYSPLVLGWVNHLPSLIGAGENKGQAILYMAGSATLSLQALTLVTILNAWLPATFTDLPNPLV